MQSKIEEFVKAVKANMPKVKGTQRICQCPCCKGLVIIIRHEYDNQFYAVCQKCKKTLRG